MGASDSSRTKSGTSHRLAPQFLRIATRIHDRTTLNRSGVIQRCAQRSHCDGVVDYASHTYVEVGVNIIRRPTESWTRTGVVFEASKISIVPAARTAARVISRSLLLYTASAYQRLSSRFESLAQSIPRSSLPDTPSAVWVFLGSFSE